MNSEDKIYKKIKNASHKGEKDFPSMDKVWNRVEEKLDNTIVVQKKNTWQKVAIAATVLLTCSIVFQFMTSDETFKGKIKNNEANPVIVSNDSVKKIINEAKEAVVDNSIHTKTKSKINSITTLNEPSVETSFYMETSKSSDVTMHDSVLKMKVRENNLVLEDKEILSKELKQNNNSESEISLSNSAYNSTNSNNAYLAPTKKYKATSLQVPSKIKAKKSKVKQPVAQTNDDLVIIDGVVKDKKALEEINSDELEEIIVYEKPLYIINGIEYSEESLFGKKPTSPYAPLDKQKITSTSILKATDAVKIYGKKGENGIIIITTKDGKPIKK